MTFYTNFSSASKSISFYKRTSSPVRRRRAPLAECQADAQYEKWCEYLHQPPKKLKVRGRSPVPKDFLAGHFVSTDSLTEDAEECHEESEERYDAGRDVWRFIYDPVVVEEHCDLNEDIVPEPSSDIYENPRMYDIDVSDIKRRLHEDIKFYKKTFRKRRTPKKNVPSTDEKEGLEIRFKDRLKVLFSKHSDWLKKTISTLKNRDAKRKHNEGYMGISFCKS
ncbi:unnamed protein product [Callosobruchus maculatus]|uniref:Uncharacterized protein n=1 Tax=Callosobruchus maculatus TaxID=64391 RepID=A0A653DGP4_CALMS|nr:unnamed protein product [Callosobruchus maculatus]